jgi:hypothetical protein
MQKRHGLVVVLIGSLCVGSLILAARCSSRPIPQFEVGFPGQGFTTMVLTNRSDRTVRIWSVQYDLKYESSRGSGQMQGGRGGQHVLRRGDFVVFATPLGFYSGTMTDESLHARCRVQVQTSWVTPFERFRHWWDRYKDAHRWTRALPSPFRVGPDAKVTVEWKRP